MIDYSIVIPVFRGEKTIEKLFLQIKHEMEKMNFRFEIIFVFDAGNNSTKEKLVALKNVFPNWIKAILLDKNYGQHCATVIGLEMATGNFIFTIDEDLQQSPADFILLINKQKEANFDLFYGTYKNRKHSFFRNFYSVVFKILLKIKMPKLNSNYTSFRLIKREIISSAIANKNAKIFLDASLSKVTNRVGRVAVSHFQDATNKSSYNFSKLFLHAVKIIFGISDSKNNWKNVSKKLF